MLRRSTTADSGLAWLVPGCHLHRQSQVTTACTAKIWWVCRHKCRRPWPSLLPVQMDGALSYLKRSSITLWMTIPGRFRCYRIDGATFRFESSQRAWRPWTTNIQLLHMVCLPANDHKAIAAARAGRRRWEHLQARICELSDPCEAHAIPTAQHEVQRRAGSSGRIHSNHDSGDKGATSEALLNGVRVN